MLNAIADVKTEAANKLNTHNSAADPHTQYAPKASPALTGKPTAPTAAQASNDTQVATTAFVKAAVAALVNGSPTALDTLQELANALGNDPNFSTTILNALSGKLAKDQNGADIADKSLFIKNIGAARAFHGAINIGGDNGAWKTSDFIAWLKSQGAFNHPSWVCKGGWYYAGNKIITDTGVGNIQLAGAVIEVFGTEAAMTIRITTPSTVTAAGAIPNSQFIYINHGDNYSPGWRRDYNTRNLPTAADVGALPTSGTAQAAAKLATPRTINGMPFDGTANIALTPANLGLTETVNLAAGALEKAKNGADIPDKTAFYNNVTLRGTMGNGMVFARCDKPGDYIVAISDPNTVSDMPLYKGQKLYGYGVLHVSQHGNFVGQEYINHSGDCAWRQKWDDGIYAPWVVALSSSRVPTAADVGAITKIDADNHYVRQGSSGVIYKNDDLAWNSSTGAYLKTNEGYSSLIWHIGINTGSASSAQFHFDYANGGLKYRSSRDGHGFEKPWARIYSDQDKPSAADVGALPANGTAVAATKLAVARKINGVVFDGTADINIASRWNKVASGSVSYPLVNSQTKSFVGTIDTGVATTSWVHDSKKYAVVLSSKGVEVRTSNPANCSWGATGELRSITRFNGNSTILIDVFTYGQNLQSGAISTWELWEIIS
ncbi:phage tail protein [Pectobacterium quasiaquaticum]